MFVLRVAVCDVGGVLYAGPGGAEGDERPRGGTHSGVGRLESEVTSYGGCQYHA